MGNNKSKRSRSSSGQKSSSGSSFSPSDIFGGSGGGLVPVFAIICGVLIGMGGAYVVKRVIFGGNKKRPDIAMIEESDRVPGRSKLKREARIRPVETAEIGDDKSQRITRVDEPVAIAATEPVAPPPAPPVAETRVAPKPDPLPPEPKHSGSSSSSKKSSASHVPAPSKAPIRVTPPPKTTSIAMLSEPPPQEPVIEEPKQAAPKFITIRNLTYSRQLFSRCAEDCLLLFRAADGGAVKAKLKKSSFARVLSNNLAYADIDGYESLADGERVIVVKSIRGMPVTPPPPSVAKHELTKPVKEEKLVETPRVEKSKRDKSTDGSGRKRGGEEGDGESPSDGVSMKNRLEGVSKAKKKDDNIEEQSGDGEEEEGGTTFQNRLKKSLD